MTNPVFHLRLLLVILVCSLRAPMIPSVNAIMTEEDRLKGWKARNFTWPPSRWIPDTPEWTRVMNHRLRQVEAMKEGRFPGFLVLGTGGLLGRNLTKYGWGITRVSSTLVQELQKDVHSKPWVNLEDLENLRTMGMRHYGESPYLVDTGEINRQILAELKELHEHWAGVELIPQVAYGLRVYRNQSQLLMHLDNPATHVVSSILHIGHSEDAGDWPLLLQDYEGNTVEVYLEPGDLLLYESSRILHGRPRILNGTWYTSLFSHYLPVDYWKPGLDIMKEMHYVVPPHWKNKPSPGQTDDLPELSAYGYGLEETSCAPYNWCDVGERIVMRGPATEGIIQSSNTRLFLPQDSFRAEL